MFSSFVFKEYSDHLIETIVSFIEIQSNNIFVDKKRKCIFYSYNLYNITIIINSTFVLAFLKNFFVLFFWLK